MEAKEMSLKEIIEGEPHRLEIPFFQRRYVWKEENWEELLHAVENFRIEKVFWGSVIIKKASEEGHIDSYTYGKGYIIDGQQRLTTIAILTKAIYDSLSKNAREDWAKNIIFNDIFFRPYSSASKDKHQLIIEHSRVDREDFEYVVRTGVFNDDDVFVDNEDSRQIRRCYAYYRNVLKGKTEEELELLMNNLYSDEKVFVLITLNENDVNEQAIFDSINRAGQKLYTSDIIKNNLFKKIMNLSNNKNEACELCDKYWDSIFWKDEIWDETRRFGNVGKSHLDFLLYCVACIKWSDESLQNINDNLESVYEKRTEGYQKDELEELIRDIAKYALIYKKYICDFSGQMDEITFSAEDHVRRLLLIMDKFSIQMFYPYLLKKLYETITEFDIDNYTIQCDLENACLKKEAMILETYIMRRRICSAGTSAYSKKCMEILNNGIKSLFSEYKMEISDENILAENKQITENLKCISKDVAKMVLFCLELLRWDKKDDMGAFYYKFELEHIMPIHWEEYWPIPSSSSKDAIDAAVKEIGNMLLLSQALNSHLKNREFSVKVEGEPATGKKAAKEGYKDKTQLKMTKEIVDNYMNTDDKVWDEQHISNRTAKLTKEVLKHWNIEKVLED